MVTQAQQTSRATQFFSLGAAAAFVLVAMVAGYKTIGLPPVVIVGGSGVAGFIMVLRRPDRIYSATDAEPSAHK